MNRWDDPGVAAAYDRFCEAHPRYTDTNRRLIDAAGIEQGQRVLDFGAGTGQTAAAIGDAVDLWCVEPADAMRSRGAARAPHARWCAGLEELEGTFDRILANSVVWQLDPFEDEISRLAQGLAPNGRLAFNIPGLVLQIPDEPGGGEDPHLVGLFRHLPPPAALGSDSVGTPLSVERVEAALANAGLSKWARTEARDRLEQRAYCDWLAIRPTSYRILPELDDAARRAALETALTKVDASSWRWERWVTWVASR